MKTLKETADELRVLPGKVRAEVIKISADYIKQKEGEDGLKKLEEKMKELGAFVDFKRLGSLTWEEDWKFSLMLATCKETFNWEEDDIFEMGRYSPRASFFIKSIMQYIVSIDTVFKKVDYYWRRHHDFAELEPVEINKKEKYVIVRLKGFHRHPLMCTYHAGYFKGVVEFSVKASEINIKETKCIHRGDEYDEYKISWN